MFTIEDEAHAELHGDFASLEEALTELRRRAQLPWDQEPNLAPCESWRTCGRRYEVVEYAQAHLNEVRRMPALEVSAAGANWIAPFSVLP